MAFFSIVIPTFNSEKDIAACCLSVIAQTFTDYEIIVQDGISTDGTLEQVYEVKKRHPLVSLNISSEKDFGVYDAMNRAIKHSAAQWLLFLGADDRLYDQNVLSSVVVQLNDTSAKMVYGNAKLLGDSLWAKDATIYDGPFSTRKLFEKNICHQAIFYNRSIFEQLGFFDTRFSVCADWDFNFRCFAKVEVKYIDQVISYFSGGGLSSTASDKFKEVSIFILKEYFKISYFNHLFKTYNWVFLHHAIVAFKEQRMLKSFHYLLLSFFHAQDKILLTKIVFRKLIKI